MMKRIYGLAESRAGRAQSTHAKRRPRRDLRLEMLESRHVLSALLFANRQSAPEPAQGPPPPEPTHEIRGIAWHDSDVDGIRFPHEPLLAGRTIYLDANRNSRLDLGETSAVTLADNPATTSEDETGAFAFTGLPAGVYHVREAPRAGWEPVTSEPQVVVLGNGGIDYLRSQLDSSHDEIAGLVPNRFNFTGGDSGTSIEDGGSDMYDVGNIISTNLASAIEYTGGAIVPGDAQFGPGSRYFTAKYPGLFVLAAQNVTLSQFGISGTTGTNGLGNRDQAAHSVNVNGRPFIVYYTQVYGAGDPSIVQGLLVPDPVQSLFSAPSSTASDGFDIQFTAQSPQEVYYLLTSRRLGNYFSQFFELALAFAQQIPRQGNSVAGLEFGSRPLGKLDGYVWYDRNENGVRDAGEPGQPNWTVYVDANGNGALDDNEIAASSSFDDFSTPNVDEAGYYSFSGFPPGSQTIRAVELPGWVAVGAADGRQVRMGRLDPVATLANLDNQYAQIVAAVPNRFAFHEGGAGETIVDGGQNMYDTGNRLSTDRAASIPYTNHAVVDGEAAFGPGSRYFTTKYPGLFAAAVAGMSIDRFEISGRTGAEGMGRVVGTSFPLRVADQDYTVFVKQIVEAATPSIIHLFVVPGDGAGIQHQFGPATEDDFHALSGLTGVSELFYLLASRHDGSELSQDDARRMATALLASTALTGLEATAVDLGYRGIFSLSGTKWHDVDSDGTRGETEPGLAGWTIYLDENEDGELSVGEPTTLTRDDDLATAEVDETGTYRFEHLPPGSQRVREVRQPGWQQQYPAEGHTTLLGGLNLASLLNNLDQDNASITALVPNRFDFTDGETGDHITDGGSNMYDDGNYLYANTWGTLPYSNRTVSTLPVFGAESQYFTAKYPGLFVLAASGTSNSYFQIAGSLGAAGQGQADVARLTTTAGGQTYTVFIKRVYNAPTPSVNHLLIVPGAATNVFQDYSSFTGSDYQALNGLDVDEFYYLLVSRQAGGFLDNAQMQAIADEFLSLIPPVTDHVGGLDFGNVRVGEVRGTIWRDRDRDGTRDTDEPGNSGFTVYLDANDNGQFDPGELSAVSTEDDPATTGIDETGSYALVNVPIGDHLVRLEQAAGWTQTHPADGYSVSVTLDPGGNVVEGIDFGIAADGRIEGIKWNDLDSDGIRDANEPGLAGFTIYVDENQDGVMQPAEPSATSAADDPATTDLVETGRYAINDLAPGSYRVREVPQSGWQQRSPESSHLVGVAVSTPDGLLANLDANNASISALVPNRFDFIGGEFGANIGDGGNDMYDGGNFLGTNLAGQIVYSNRSIQPADFQFGPGSRYFTAKYPGLFMLGAFGISISDFVIAGNNGADGGGQVDGAVLPLSAGGQPYTLFVKRVYNAGDPSVNHIIIVPGNGVGVSHNFSQNTDDDFHAVTGLQNATELYYLLVAGANGGFVANSDILAIAGQFLVQIPRVGTTVTDVDFGNRQIVSTGEIRGSVWHDGDHNGLRDPGEPTLSGWTVYLDTDNNGQLDDGEPRMVTPADDPATLDVDETGVFAFTGLAAGTYQVAQIPQAEWMRTAPPEGPNGRREHTIPLLLGGQIAGNVDFGNRLPGPDIELRGMGQIIPDGDTSPSTLDDTDFGNVELGGDFVDHEFTIHNVGEAPLALTATPIVRIVGPNAGDFSITQQPPLSNLNSSAQTRFTVRFVPGAAGNRSATIEIDSTDFDEPLYNFVLHGAGTMPNVRAVDDVFTGAVEDTPFSTASGASLVVPLQATDWAVHEELLRSVNQYPIDSAGRPWNDRDYDIASSTVAGAASPWRTGLRAPFEFGTIDAFDNINPTTFVNVPAASETTFVARRNFTLSAAQATAASGVITYTCDSGCIFYINGIWAGSSPNMPPGGVDPNFFAFNAGDEDLPHATLNVNFLGQGIPLFEGNNVLAVEVHNDNTTSTDLGLDASLSLSETLAGLLLNDDLANAVGPVSVQILSPAFDESSGVLAGNVQTSDNSGNFTFTPLPNFAGRARFEYSISDATSVSVGQAIIEVASRNDPPVASADAYTVNTIRPLVVSARGEPLIEANDTRWYYMDDGSDQDTANPAWKLGPDAGFDPATAGWRGPHLSQLGFGDGDERTPINNAGPSGGVTYYFFTRFDAPTLPEQLILEIRRDDGAAVYINGVEVVTDNLPTPHPFNVGALTTDNDDGVTFFRTVIDTANLDLRDSDNTIAVEVHQVDMFSSDVTFDLRLFDPANGLLGNDEDIDNPPSSLTALLVSNPIDPLTQGTLVLNPDGTFTFTPANPQVAGSASFSYRVQDAAGAISPAATVTLTFVATDSGPVVAADDTGVTQFATTEDMPLVIDATSGPAGPIGIGVLANDSHPGDETDPVTLVVVSPPASGGSVVFDPANNGGFTYTPGQNFHGTDTFTYQVNDGAVLSNVATVEITVLSVDDPPIAAPDGYTVPSDTTLNIGFATGLLANDTDAEGDDLELVTLVPGTEPQYGTLNLSGDGSFTYMPNAGFIGQDTFMYTVQANGLESATALVTIDVVSGSTPETDLDGDGRVTLADVAIFIGNFGAADVTDEPADFDGDGRVGLRDLIFLRDSLEMEDPAAPAVARSRIAPDGIDTAPLANNRLRTTVRSRSARITARMQAFADLSDGRVSIATGATRDHNPRSTGNARPTTDD
jgi:hypothetical protein